jgi:hypothetical protein
MNVDKIEGEPRRGGTNFPVNVFCWCHPSGALRSSLRYADDIKTPPRWGCVDGIMKISFLVNALGI